LTGGGELGLLLMLAFVFLLCMLVGVSRIRQPLKGILVAAILLRVIGSLARHYVLYEVYGGNGDAGLYYRWGLRYADQFWELDFSPFFDPDQWRGVRWWGTNFVSYPIAIVLAFIGPSELGGFIAFSLFALIGLIGFVQAYRRAYPGAPLHRYAAWVLLFPPLWFWPSSIGKEAIMLMGLGLATAGFVGRDNTTSNWPLLLVGLFFVVAIRPQVGAVMFVSLMVGQWLSLSGRWTLARVLQGFLIVVVGIAGIRLSFGYLGVASFDMEGVISYMEENTARSSGGSDVGVVGVGVGNIPIALLNIFGRPFLWESRNFQMLLSAGEVLTLWGVIWMRRKNLRAVFSRWREDRLVRTAIPFVLLYATTLGMMIANLGIIARQRVLILPLVFIVIEAVPVGARRAHIALSALGRGRPVPMPPHFAPPTPAPLPFPARR